MLVKGDFHFVLVSQELSNHGRLQSFFFILCFFFSILGWVAGLFTYFSLLIHYYKDFGVLALGRRELQSPLLTEGSG